VVRDFQVVVQGDAGAMEWGASELAYMERNAELFRARLGWHRPLERGDCL